MAFKLSTLSCPAIDPSTAPPASVETFLAKYRLIECSCCHDILGFIDRQTGYIKCAPQHSHSEGNNFVVDQARLSSCGGEDKNTISSERVVSTNAEKKLDEQKQIVDEVDGCASYAPRTAGYKKDAMKLSVDVVDDCVSDASKKISAIPALCKPTSAANDPVKKEPEARPVVQAPVICDANATDNKDMRQSSFDSVPRTIATDGKAATAAVGGTSVPGKKERSAAQVSKTLGQPLGVNPFLNKTKPLKKWRQMKYSQNLASGAEVKATFIYALNKYQVQACADEDAAYAVQEKIESYVAANPHKTYAKLNRKPVVDEVVLGRYNEEDYYRARVMDVSDKDCTVMFIDFGDTGLLNNGTLIEISEELMQAPVYSLTLGLSGIPREIPKIEVPEVLSNRLYDKVKLELVGTLQNMEADPVEGILKDDKGQSINERLLSILCNH